jgi:phosphoribosylanthranilate isomerase
MIEVKICGLTTPTDAAAASAAGADYLGMILAGAGGPRMLDIEAALEVRSAMGTGRAVGVFGRVGIAEVASYAERLRLDVIQLHGNPTPQDIVNVAGSTGLPVWGVCRISGAVIPPAFNQLLQVAHAVVLDAASPNGLGGTGTVLEWESLSAALVGREGRLVLAGGLRPANVRDAIRWIGPDVVDVSSGVERAPGRKDHDLMRSFVAAARSGGSA